MATTRRWHNTEGTVPTGAHCCLIHPSRPLLLHASLPLPPCRFMLTSSSLGRGRGADSPHYHPTPSPPHSFSQNLQPYSSAHTLPLGPVSLWRHLSVPLFPCGLPHLPAQCTERTPLHNALPSAAAITHMMGHITASAITHCGSCVAF